MALMKKTIRTLFNFGKGCILIAACFII